MRLAPLLIFAALFVSTPARADTDTCVTAAEDGQRAQKAGRLVVANESFAECSATSCPASVREDCSKWRAEVVSHLSTFVVDAKAPDGTDATDVTVRIDGVLASKQLDGRAIPTDPGRHRLSFERPASPIVVQDVLLREGEHARMIRVQFALESAPVATTEVRRPRGHSPWPFILGGVGVAALTTGIIVVALAPQFPDNCDRDSLKCQATFGSSLDAQDATRQASKSQNMTTAGALTITGGSVLLAAGIVWFLVEPTGPKTTGMPVVPWVGREGGGLLLSQSF